MRLPDDVLKEGNTARVLLVREALLAKAQGYTWHVFPAKVGDDAHGFRLGVTLPGPPAYPNADTVPPHGPVIVRLAIHETHAETPAQGRMAPPKVYGTDAVATGLKHAASVCLDADRTFGRLRRVPRTCGVTLAKRSFCVPTWVGYWQGGRWGSQALVQLIRAPVPHAVGF